MLKYGRLVEAMPRARRKANEELKIAKKNFRIYTLNKNFLKLYLFNNVQIKLKLNPQTTSWTPCIMGHYSAIMVNNSSIMKCNGNALEPKSTEA